MTFRLFSSLEIWLLVIASMIGVGVTWAVISKVYGKIRHPRLIPDSNKSVFDFIVDSFAML